MTRQIGRGWGTAAPRSLTAAADFLLEFHVLQLAQPSGPSCLTIHTQATHRRLPGGALLIAAARCAATLQTPAPHSCPCNAKPNQVCDEHDEGMDCLVPPCLPFAIPAS